MPERRIDSVIKSDEIIKTLNKEIDIWKKAIGKFTRGSDWYNEAVKRVRAFKYAIDAIKDRDYLRLNCIEFGKDYWSDRYEITETSWQSEDGKTTCTSFRITPKEKIDGDDY